MNNTFVKYLNAVRIIQVHKLLQSTNMQLGEIACRTGFSSGEYMTRVFRRVYGVSPSVYRKQLKKNKLMINKKQLLKFGIYRMSAGSVRLGKNSFVAESSIVDRIGKK